MRTQAGQGQGTSSEPEGGMNKPRSHREQISRPEGTIRERGEKQQERIPSLNLYRTGTSQYGANKSPEPTQNKTRAVLSLRLESKTRPRNPSEVGAWVFPRRERALARAQGRAGLWARGPGGGGGGGCSRALASEGACQGGHSGGAPTPGRGVRPHSVRKAPAPAKTGRQVPPPASDGSTRC